VVWLDASAAGNFRRAVEQLICRRGNCSSSLKSSLSLSLSLAAFFLSFSLLPKSVSSSFCLVYSSTHIVSFCCCCSRSLFRSLEGTTSQLWNLLSLQSCSRSPPNLSLSLSAWPCPGTILSQRLCTWGCWLSGFVSPPPQAFVRLNQARNRGRSFSSLSVSLSPPSHI